MEQTGLLVVVRDPPSAVGWVPDIVQVPQPVVKRATGWVLPTYTDLRNALNRIKLAIPPAGYSEHKLAYGL